jgi:hypothetical protein
MRRHLPRGRSRKQVLPSLLIVRFDSERLQADGLTLGGETSLVSALARLGIGADVRTLDITNTSDLLEKFAALVRERRSFDVVVAIGHSSEKGFQIASDLFVPWEPFAEYLKPFAPRRLLMIACQAGRWPAAAKFFRRLPHLQRIYASPTNVKVDLATLMLGILPYILSTKSPSSDVILGAKVVALALTGSQLREWKRNDHRGRMDLLEDLVECASRSTTTRS